MGKMWTLTQFPLEPGCEDYSFLDQAVKDFEHGLDSILNNWVETLELDASFDESDVMASPVYLDFLCWVSTISDNSEPQLTHSIKSCKLCYQAEALLLPVPQVGKISASKLFCYFSCHPAVVGFQTSSPLDNITLSPANTKTNQSLSEF